jgi:hypothetical protein
MAAATQIPAGINLNVCFSAELIDKINLAISVGIFAGSDTVTTALANLGTENGSR